MPVVEDSVGVSGVLQKFPVKAETRKDFEDKHFLPGTILKRGGMMSPPSPSIASSTPHLLSMSVMTHSLLSCLPAFVQSHAFLTSRRSLQNDNKYSDNEDLPLFQVVIVVDFPKKRTCFGTISPTCPHFPPHLQNANSLTAVIVIQYMVLVETNFGASKAQFLRHFGTSKIALTKNKITKTRLAR